MEALVLILIAVLFALSGKNRKKKPRQGGAPDLAQAREKAARRTAVQAAARTAKSVKPVKPASDIVNMEAGRDFMARLHGAAQVRLDALADERDIAASAQGVSALDGEGCVGGSMAHEHTEGESHAEHARHVAALRQRELEEERAREEALDMAAMNARRLRRAVVMAEVLDKPKALKMRRAGG